MHSLRIYRATEIYFVIFVLPKCDPIEQKSILVSSAYNFESKPSNGATYGQNLSMNAPHLHNYAI
ncbi:hypothetical protein F0T03_12365 [Yersinia canariae]|uniref:Uncharacterized protein n=1 Tax=Yersinia canariae TaxID=2607663 RepID=A0A857F1H3_9GAMM|nr:hypothetical protein F0T03_12365 [Yersinia canariae]